MVKGNFWLGVAAGFVIMIFGWDFHRVLGPFIGGLVAGLVARGGFWIGITAGLAAGIIGTAIVVFLGSIISFSHMGVGGVLFWLLLSSIVLAAFSVFGAAGGAAGGMMGRGIDKIIRMIRKDSAISRR